MSGKSSGIRAVIYDVDGTMVNSEPLHVAAWDSALQLSGRNLTDLSESFRATMAGRKPIAIAEGMVSELKLAVAPKVFLDAKSAIFLEKAKTNLEGMPGVVESVHRLQKDGYDLAIGTSLDRDYVNLILSKLGIVGSFKVIVTGDQIKNGKPHPETYLKVAERLSRLPEECIVLEDAASGIESAKAAGGWCIAVENQNAVLQDTSKADIVVDSLDKVTNNLISSIAQ